MYELIVLGKAGGDSDSLLTKVEKIIKDNNASSVSSQKMGKKLLPYMIKKQSEAEFMLFNFDAPGEAIVGITDNLKIEQEAILRYMMVRAKEAKAIKGKNIAASSAVETFDEIKDNEQTKAKKTAKSVSTKAKVTVKTKGKK